MCIMLAGPAPNTTRLYNVPVTVVCNPEDGIATPGIALLYTNDLAPPAGTGAVMVVPFPNPDHCTAFPLLDVKHTQQLRDKLRAAFPRPVEAFLTNASDGWRGKGMEKAAVHVVGNYIISVLPRATDVHTAIDWSRFNRPANLATRLAVLNDPAVLPGGPDAYGLVVAQAFAAVRGDGFGIVLGGTQGFFPTCHEAPAVRGSLVYYDVDCYAVGMTITDPRVADTDVRKTYVDTADVMFPAFGTSSATGRKVAVCMQDVYSNGVTHVWLNGWQLNRNLGAAVVEDVAAIAPAPRRSYAKPDILFEPHVHPDLEPRGIGLLVTLRSGALFDSGAERYPGLPGGFCDCCGEKFAPDMSLIGLGKADICMSCALPLANAFNIMPRDSRVAAALAAMAAFRFGGAGGSGAPAGSGRSGLSGLQVKGTASAVLRR